MSARAVAVVLVHAALATAAGLSALRLERDASPFVFLPEGDGVRDACRRFRDAFGEDGFVVVTCRGGGGVPRERALALARALEGIPDVRRVLVPEPGSPLTSSLRLEGEGGTRLSLTVLLGRPGRDALAAIESVAARFPDLRPALAGEPLLNRALDDAADAVGRRLFPLLAAAMAALLWFAYRSPGVLAAVLAVTAEAVLLGLGVLAVLGHPVNLLTVMLPVLLMALTVALCVHLVNAFRLRAASGASPREAVRGMLRDEWRPCLVTTVTTAAGFGSFALSRIEPLRVLGVSMAIAILAALAVAFTLLPALLVLIRPRPREGLRLGDLLARAVPPLLRRRPAILAGSALFVGASLLAVPRIPAETNGLHYLAASHPVRAETERLGREGVGTASLEIVLHAAGRPLAALAAPLRAIEERLAALPAPARGVVTPLTLAREATRAAGPAAEALALAPLPGVSELSSFRDVARGLVRVSLRIDPVSVDGYRSLRRDVESALAAAVAGTSGAVGWEITGPFPVIMRVQEELLSTLLASLGATALTILAVLAVAQRSLKTALLTLVPAALPLAFVVLACAVFGVGLSVATVMVLAVTLGIVTDDSVHMFHALSAGSALEDVLRRVGTAVAETSIAILLGFAVLGGAGFLPTRQFGLLTAGAMAVALFADLVTFPALVLWRRAPCLPAREPRPAAVPEIET